MSLASDIQSPVALILCGGGSRGALEVVEIGSGQFVDGGIANNVPLDQTVALGARDIVMIQCVCCEGRTAPYKGLINILARSFSIALDCKYATDQMHFGGHARIHIVRPRFPLEIGLLDFRYSADLIQIGYQQSLIYFKQNPLPHPAGAPTIGECTPDRTPAMQT